MRHDLQSLRQSIDLADLIERYGIDLVKAGNELESCCPFHSENTPSFRVFEKDGRQAFYCFGCGAGGDHLDFIRHYDSVELPEACDRLAAMVGGSYRPDQQEPRRTSRDAKPTQWTHSVPPASQQEPNSLRVQRAGEWVPTPVVTAWPYHDASGQVISYACRVEYDKPDGTKGKDVIPVCWMLNTETGEERWRQSAMLAPRNLYGLPDLIANPDAQVIVVEGEKAADAARVLFADMGLVVVTWAGGSKAIIKTEWSSLSGRKVVLWPDCDGKQDKDGATIAYQKQAGMAAMLAIAGVIDAECRIVAVPYAGEIKDGWDLADALADRWDGAQAITYMRERLCTVDQIMGMAPVVVDSDPEPDDDDQSETYADYIAQADAPPAPTRREPFKILGYNRSTCYYLPDGFRQVVAVRTSDHSKLRMMEIAPLHYWQSNFPSDKRSGDATDWSLAAESLIRQCQRAGLWSEDMIRGRGAWWDDGRPVVHLGDRVIVDGKEHELGDTPGKMVYELNSRIDIATDDPLPNSEAVKLVRICEALRWQRPISGKLLAGWVFLAPICGALDWRPHIWITGGAGSGKSTITANVIRRILQKNMQFVQGETTEAGLRQELGHDAIPVVFDEIESQDERAAGRVNSIMDLMTIASSETGAKLVKGGANGKAQSFSIRSMFCFSSIGVNLKQHAAKTRVTVLDMRQKPEKETQEDLDQYSAMLQSIYDTITPDYVERLQARAVEAIGVIRHNSIIFAEAASLSQGSRRFGDQVGTLLAGAYALHSMRQISRAEALKFVEEQDWADHDDGSDSADEISCLQFLMAQQVIVDTSHGPKRRTLGELVDLCATSAGDNDITSDNANLALRRCGLAVEDGHDPLDVPRLLIAKNHAGLSKIMSQSAWSASLFRTLKRIDDSQVTTPRRFAGVQSRAVSIPIKP